MGAATIYLVRTSPQLEIVGNIWAIGESTRSIGSRFSVTADGGSNVAKIRCNYNGPGLREGDRARVRYVAYDRRLVEMTMLNGPYTGWRLEEPSQPMGMTLWVVLGVLSILGGWRELRKADSEPQRAG
jgi:hypothetical protein